MDLSQVYTEQVLIKGLPQIVSMEVIALNGVSVRLTELSERLIAEKGVQHGKLIMTRVD